MREPIWYAGPWFIEPVAWTPQDISPSITISATVEWERSE